MITLLGSKGVADLLGQLLGRAYHLLVVNKSEHVARNLAILPPLRDARSAWVIFGMPCRLSQVDSHWKGFNSFPSNPRSF
jgi:hypothetical protein